MSATQTIDWSKYEDKSSAPQIDFSKYENTSTESAPQEGTGFVSHALKSIGSMLTPAPAPSSVGEAVKQGVLGGTGALGSIINAGQEYKAARERGHGVPYSAIAGASTAVGVSPERMEQAAEQGDTAGVLGEAAVPTAIALGGAAASKVARSLPSAQRAGAVFADVKGSVGNVAINTSKVGDTALELYTQSDRGAQLPMAVRKLLNRVTKPESPPLTYAEAKDFQSNISNLSANEKMSLKPNTVRLVGQLNQDLKASLVDAADHVGKGQQLTDAFTEYRNAMRLKGFNEKAIEYGLKTLLAGMGLGAAEKVRRMVP